MAKNERSVKDQSKSATVAQRIALWDSKTFSKSPLDEQSTRVLTSKFTERTGSLRPTRPAKPVTRDEPRRATYSVGSSSGKESHSQLGPRTSSSSRGVRIPPKRPPPPKGTSAPLSPPPPKAGPPRSPTSASQGNDIRPSKHRPSKTVDHSDAGALKEVHVSDKIKRREKGGDTPFYGDGLYDLSNDTDDITTFKKTVMELRQPYVASDLSSNPGCVISPTLSWLPCSRDMLEVAVYRKTSKSPIQLQVSAESQVSAVIGDVLTKEQNQSGEEPLIVLSVEKAPLPVNDYVLKVVGRFEILENAAVFGHYHCVHMCCRFGMAVRLELLELDEVPRTLARTEMDDVCDVGRDRLNTFLRASSTTSLSKQGLGVLIETFHKEVGKLMDYTQDGFAAQRDRVVQVVKAFIISLANVESPPLTNAIQPLLVSPTRNTRSLTCPETVGSPGAQSPDISKKRAIRDIVRKLSKTLTEEVATYCKAFDVAFMHLVEPLQTTVNLNQLDRSEMLLIRVISGHRLRNVRRDVLCVKVQLLYAGQPLMPAAWTDLSSVTTKAFVENVVWDKWITFLPLVDVPREAQVHFTLCRQIDPTEAWTDESMQPLGSFTMSVFNYDGHLSCGRHMFGLWPSTSSKSHPVMCTTNNIRDPDSMILQVELGEPSAHIVFPEPNPFELMADEQEHPVAITDRVQHALRVITRKGLLDTLSSAEKTLLWTQREACWRQLRATCPRGLALLLSSVPSWSFANAFQAHALARSWTSLGSVNSMELLNAHFADSFIRTLAVEWLSPCPDHQLCDILPQLLQAMKYEQHCLCSLVIMLLRRALKSPQVAHRLYWHIELLRNDQFYRRLYDLLAAALQVMAGSALREEFRREEQMMATLKDIAVQVKAAAASTRTSLLTMLLQNTELFEFPLHLPLDPSMKVSGFAVDDCAVFNSNAAPLKLSFVNSDPLGSNINVIYKVGDDLRQDQLTLQVIGIMDKVWLEEGLDLRVITYQCLPYDAESGMLEMVSQSRTLREIQTMQGLTGSFKERPLMDWLAHHNPSQRQLQQAVENFTLSCAAYCVATYVLGICDRHNDNIMLRRTGHLFHIDFARFLGNAQMFGAFKRDRVPFVLTPDMAHVINGGDKPGPQFQEFIDICCQAFNILRHYAGYFLNILSLMMASGMEELSSVDDVNYVRDALMPMATDVEATIAFTRMIEDSLSSWFTKINFFIHNLAQIKSGQMHFAQLLSFCPNNYTMESCGRVVQCDIVQVLKRTPENFYVYGIEVHWDNSAGKEGCRTIYRRYSEFYELHQRLQDGVPGASLPVLPSKAILSSKKQVAERRKSLLNTYLLGLIRSPPPLSECDLVITFLTQTLRDQQFLKVGESSEGDGCRGIGGSVKLSVAYDDEEKKLRVVVMHAKNLDMLDGSAPDPYVKLYLVPDPLKLTKRKTRIAKNTHHPTYNESIEYSITPEEAEKRQLQITVWNHDTLSENLFLGCVHLDLKQFLDVQPGVSEWYDLKPMFV